MTAKSQHILFILDRSGSMSGQAGDVIGGFNTYIDEMKAQAQADGLSTVVSLVTFADHHEVVFAAKPVADVSPLTHASYRTMGSTALLDAVHYFVSKYLEKLGQGAFANGNEDAPPVLVVIFTDGEENASHEVTWPQLQTLIQKCEGLGNWTFTYVGAHLGAWDQADQLQMKRGNVLDAQSMPMAEVTEKLLASAKTHRAAYRDLNQKSLDSTFED